jgi:hypothetical protein
MAVRGRARFDLDLAIRRSVSTWSLESFVRNDLPHKRADMPNEAAPIVAIMVVCVRRKS